MKRAIFIFLMLGMLSAGFLFRETLVGFSIVTGQSMSPALEYGDLLKIARVAPEDVEPGDIIIFTSPGTESPGTIAHRVIRVIENGGRVTGFRTMGDNNRGYPDPWTVPAADVLGKASLKISYLGVPLLFLKSPPGIAFLFLGICLSAAGLYSEEIKGLTGRRLRPAGHA